MNRSRVDRRRFLRTLTTGAAGTAVAGLAGSGASAATGGPDASPRRTATGTAEFQWLGVSGWRVDVAGDTLLIDPYLSRYPVGLASGAFDPNTQLTVDAAAIDPHVGSPKHIFVTHTHWDHVNDVPYLAGEHPDARVYGTLTTYHVATAMEVKASQLSVVKGGEVFDFGDYTVEVVASLHSRNAGYGITFPGVHTSRPPQPTVIADLPEGDTLAFQVTVAGGPAVFFMGASDYVERNLTGLAPDVAMVPLNAADATYEYVGRLMRALDHPATVVPVHWDDFESPLQNPPKTDARSRTRLENLIEAVREASPTTEVLVPEYLTPYRFS